MASPGYDNYSWNVPKQMTRVHLAAYFGLSEVIIALLKNGQDPNFKDTYGRTPLSWAAENGYEAIVKLLLAKDNVDPDSKDNKGRTVLSWAAENGYKAVVKLLLAKDGVDLDSKSNSNWTPLSLAAENGHEAVVKLLLAKDGVVLDSKSTSGWTPLSLARRQGHSNVVKLLLEKYEENGIVVRDEDKDFAHPAAEGRITCDICLLIISDFDGHYYCGICYDGDFDVC